MSGVLKLGQQTKKEEVKYEEDICCLVCGEYLGDLSLDSMWECYVADKGEYMCSSCQENHYIGSRY